MFLRRIQRKKSGETYDYWALVESVRTKQGPRQRVVATIGKLPGLKEEGRNGWEEIGRLLSGKPRKEGDLFEERVEPPEWVAVDMQRVSIERVRRLGDVYLGLALWQRLKLDEIFDILQGAGREEIPWAQMFCVSVLARFCKPSSELAIAEGWYEKTALEDILGVAVEKVNEDRLYRTLDNILPHKDEVCKHLQQRYAQWFGAEFDFLFYSIGNYKTRMLLENSLPMQQRRYDVLIFL
jgi:hypothetical protein